MKMQRPKKLLAVLLSIFVVAELVVTVILSTVAAGSGEGTKSATKQLIDFSNLGVGTGIHDTDWPAGISKLDYDKFSYNSTVSVDVAENNGDKFLKFNFDQPNNVDNKTTIDERGRHHDIFLKVSVPYKYIAYMQDFSVDMVYNYRKNIGSEQSKAYYILGLSDGGNIYSKSTDANHATISKDASVQNINVTKSVTDLGKFTGDNVKTFLGDTPNLDTIPKWNLSEFNALTKVDIIIMVSPPDILNANDRAAGYYFGIKGVSITIEGPADEIDSLDEEDLKDTTILDFEGGSTLAEVKANSKTDFGYTANSELSHDAASGENAFLFRGIKPTTGWSDYAANFGFALKGEVAKSIGMTFMAKNISDHSVSMRVWIAVGNDTGPNAHMGKYQYIINLPANMTEYQRVLISWDNVGMMNFVNGGAWWSGTSSGNAISADELASGLSFQFKNYESLQSTDPGVLYDDFHYVTKKFKEERTVTVVDFSGAEVGSKLPSNIDIDSRSYGGSTEIVENINGSKSLRVNYDVPAATNYKQDWFEAHHMRCRPYTVIKINIPQGSLTGVASVSIDMTNNRSSVGVMDNENRIYTDTQWNFAIGNSITDVYGKTTQVNDYVNWIGGKVVTKIPVGAIRCGTHEMNNWVDPSRTKITKEDLADANSMLFYISAPDCDGTEGESFQLNSITLHFDEPSEYAELAVRDIITPTDAEPTTSGDISVKPIPIGNKDANHSDFTRAYEINVKNASNTEAVVFKNTLTEYHRNALPFYNKNTAIFHMFAYSNVDSTFKLSAVDLNGAELSTTIVIPAVTTKLYTEVSASLKDAYDAAVAANPEFKFNLTDIRAIKVLPIVTGATTVKIAAPTLLTSAYVSSADDPEKQKKVNLINFDNCAPGTYGDNVELPSNLAIRGYEGTRRIVETADGSNALQVDFDKPLEVSGGELHQTSRRTNVTFDITIPAGSLEKIDYITFTLTYNGFPIAEQNTIEKQSVITMIANGDGVFVKQGQSAFPVSADKGQSLTWRLQVKNGFASSQSYYMTNWMDPASVIPTDDSHYRTMKTIHLYFAIPALDNEDIKKGMNMQLNSIDMVFTEPPLYNEEYTRLVNDGEARNIVSTNKNTITSTRIDLNSNNVNYRTFKKYYTIDAKKGNTAPVMVENALTKFMRNITPFVDTATFRMFYHAENATKVQISVINYKGEKLPFLVDLEKSKTAKFNEFEASFKEIYDEFIANGGVFDLTDIRGFEILPISTTAVKFDVSSPAIWSGATGTGGSQGNFYYSLDDDSARIEAYDYNIHDGYEAIVEYLDIDATIAENGTRVPANTKILKIAKVTIKDDFGNLAQPAGKFWTSFKLPDGINHDNVRIAELFYDGSMLNVKRIVFDPNNYVSFKDIFASKILAILEVIPEEEEEVITPPEKEEEESIVPDNQNEEIIEEIIEEDKTQNEEVVENSSQTIIRHKRRKKNTVTESGFDSWLWIAIAAAAVAVVVVAGLVVFIIFRKKRNVKKGAQ